MSKNREVKEQVVADIIEKFKNAQSVAFVSYSGLTVEQGKESDTGVQKQHGSKHPGSLCRGEVRIPVWIIEHVCNGLGIAQNSRKTEEVFHQHQPQKAQDQGTDGGA